MKISTEHMVGTFAWFISPVTGQVRESYISEADISVTPGNSYNTICVRVRYKIGNRWFKESELFRTKEEAEQHAEYLSKLPDVNVRVI